MKIFFYCYVYCYVYVFCYVYFVTKKAIAIGVAKGFTYCYFFQFQQQTQQKTQKQQQASDPASIPMKIIFQIITSKTHLIEPHLLKMIQVYVHYFCLKSLPREQTCAQAGAAAHFPTTCDKLNICVNKDHFEQQIVLCLPLTQLISFAICFKKLSL